jgi:hypothetical protein
MTSSQAKKDAPSEAQEVCIDLPGESVQCWRSSDKVRVTLRKHRDIFFDINFKKDAIYTIESHYDFYSPRDKKLLRKVSFWDGDRFHLWVGREFKGSLVLKSNDHVLGVYEINKLDAQEYGADPKTKPEPLMVFMGKKDLPSSFAYTANDPFGIDGSLQLIKPAFDPKLALMRNFGTAFDYIVPDTTPVVNEYVAVTEALPHEIQPQVLKQLDAGDAIVGKVGEIFLAPKNQAPSLLYTAIASAAAYISGNDFLTSNSFKETAGYLQEHFKSLDRIMMRVRIEKRVKGKYRVILKGKPVTRWIGEAIGSTTRVKAIHETIALGSERGAFIDGGFGRGGRAGYGGVKRMLLTTAENFHGGMKIQVIGTVIDIIVDANTVYFDEKGSKDLSEFLGRAGVSIVKAGATAALGGAFAAIGLSFITVVAGTAAIPVLAVVAIVVGGYIAAATVIDKVDDIFNVKNSVAEWAR